MRLCNFSFFKCCDIPSQENEERNNHNHHDYKNDMNSSFTTIESNDSIFCNDILSQKSYACKLTEETSILKIHHFPTIEEEYENSFSSLGSIESNVNSSLEYKNYKNKILKTSENLDMKKNIEQEDLLSPQKLSVLENDNIMFSFNKYEPHPLKKWDTSNYNLRATF